MVMDSSYVCQYCLNNLNTDCELSGIDILLDVTVCNLHDKSVEGVSYPLPKKSTRAEPTPSEIPTSNSPERKVRAISMILSETDI